MSLAGKRAFVMGFASPRSFANGIAQAWNAAGAQVAIGVQNDRFIKSVEEATSHWSKPPVIVCCDVQKDGEIQTALSQVGQAFDGKVDAVVHSLAYASAAAMKGRMLDVSRKDFLLAHEISSYSLIEVARESLPYFQAAGGGSLMALSFIGAEQVFREYSVMGAAKASLESIVRYLAADMGPYNVRVNTIRAGPITTLAARGIRNFSGMLEHSESVSPIQHRLTVDDVGAFAAFLSSDGAQAITGQTLTVDCGFSAMGM